MLADYAFQAFVAGDVSVNLSGADVGVTEQRIATRKSGAVVHQMSSESMAQAVRAEVGDAGGLGVLLHNHPGQLAADALFWLTNNSSAARVFQQ